MTTKTTEIVKLDMAQYGLEENKAQEIASLYIPMIKMLSEMEAAFNEVVKKEITTEVSFEARKLRLIIAKIRTDGDKARKSAKDESLRIGRAIQGGYNTLEWATKSKEEKLLEIEKHQERIEDERKSKLKEDREKMLEKYEVETEHIQLGEMSTEVWDNYFNGVKLQHENKIAAEKKAEAERVAKEKSEREEQERIRKENEQLRKEAEAKEREMKSEREKADKERKELEEKARKEREIAEAKAKKELEAKAKVEAELQAKKDAEEKAEADKQAEIEAELSASDHQKFMFVIIELEELKVKYSFKSKKYQKLQGNVNELIDKIITFSQDKVG